MKTTGESGLTKLISLVKTALAAKAPTSHASSATTYGKGTSSAYGHVKLSDSTTATTAAASGGTAATPKAVSAALAAAKSYADSVAGGTAADYVVEQGTSGIWAYRKWSSGMIVGMRYVDEKQKRYDSVGSMPTYYREEAQKLVDRGVLKGRGDDNLDVSDDMLRTMIICQRMLEAGK